MEPNLMPCIPDLCHLLWERFDCVGGAEPGGFDMVLVPELEQPVDTYGGAVYPPGDIGRVLLRAIAGIDPGQSLDQFAKTRAYLDTSWRRHQRRLYGRSCE